MNGLALTATALLLLAAAAGAQDFSRQVVNELNLARTQPRLYAGIVAGTNVRGDRKAVAEAVKFLRKTRPLPPLQWCAPLADAARDHVAAQGPEGGFGHKSRAGDSRRRIERHTGWLIRIGETIHYGTATPRGVVVAWIVDSGVRNRGHRKLLFEPKFRLAGAAHGSHARFGRMTVADFAAGVTGRREAQIWGNR